jgi:hypothetical protein
MMATGSMTGNLVLIVGCPRSGTTWVQRMLAEHPKVRTGQESHVFNYLAPLLERWREDLEHGGKRPAGLGCYLREEEFLAALRGFSEELLRPLVGDLGDGEVFVEKTPSHARRLPTIRELLPEVRVIHLVRDPRDVVASLLAASRTWAEGWAPSSAGAAARKWLAYSRAVRRARSLFAADRFLEISYESLQRDTAGELRRCLEFIRLPHDDAWVEAAVEANRGGRGHGRIPLGGEVSARSGSTAVEEPAGFIRRAASGGWRSDLTFRQKLVVWRVLRKEMAVRGYDWAPPFSRRRAGATNGARIVGDIRATSEGLSPEP